VIREATLADVPVLVELGERFRAEYYSEILASNTEQMTEVARRLIAIDHGLLLVDDRGGALVGMLGGFVYDHPISGSRTAVEMFWYVMPEFRGAGIRLLKRFERWAHDAGASLLQMIAPSSEVGSMYERMGFTYVETTYQKGL
jgi:GNAT superfamily N-acetyltransferase